MAATFADGLLLGIVLKNFLSNSGEFYEARNFTSGKAGYEYIDLEGELIPFATSLLFICENIKQLVVAA